MKPIYTLDLETDPFAHEAEIKPFVCGIHDGKNFRSEWGKDCVAKSVEILRRLEPGYVYGHNAGRFDYLLGYLPYARGSMRIINGRVVEMDVCGHKLRDSYAILPFPLSAYKKTEIDYQKMNRRRREKNRREILDYLKDDCFDLWTLVTAFFAEFGNRLTVGGSAMRQLKKFHEFECGGAAFDADFRTDFYYGGRVQCFETGIIERPLKIYDVNSMYPSVMKDCLHPVGTEQTISDKIDADTCFVVATGTNYGAFPTRTKNGSLDFTVKNGTFSTTIHEWNAALATGTFRPERIVKTIGFAHRITFAEFVDHFYSARKQARLVSDRIHDLFYKFVLNSAYGKFAQNPDNFYEYQITPIGYKPGGKCPICKPESAEDIDDECKWCEGYGTYWLPDSICEGSYTIWRCPTTRKSYYNIATGASITGAARAILLRGLAASTKPIYCDTDSIICSDLAKPSDDSTLGAWKLEGLGTHAAICGKKLYAVFQGDTCIKKAHKGVHLKPEQIMRIARGEEIETASEAPTFKLDGSYGYIKRRVRMTQTGDRKWNK